MISKESIIERKFKKLHLKLLLSILTLVIISSFALFFLHFKELENHVLPEIEKKNKAVGMLLEKDLERALNYDIPLEKLKRMDVFFQDILKDHKEILFLAVSNTNGKILYNTKLDKKKLDVVTVNNKPNLKMEKHDNFYHSSFGLNHQEKIAGILHIGTNANYISSTLNEISYDALIILIISLVIAAEIIFFIIHVNLTNPIEKLIEVSKNARMKSVSINNIYSSKDEIGSILNGFNSLLMALRLKSQTVLKKIKASAKKFDHLKEFQEIKAKAISKAHTFGHQKNQNEYSQTPHIRTPIFLFIFAEMLPISFLATYGSIFYEPVFNIPKDIVIGLPVIAFMLVCALFTPFSGQLADKYGLKKTFLWGVAISGFGYIAIVFANSILALTLIRCINAIGFALSCTTSQAILARARTKNGESSSNTFLFAFASATLCGAPIGAILAQNIGYNATFFLSGVISLILGALAYKFIIDPPQIRSTIIGNQISNMKILFKDPQFLKLLILSGLPSKIMYSGLLFFLVPVYLTKIGTSQSVIGRITMLYGLCLLIMSPFLAKVLPKSNQTKWHVFLGTLLMSLSCISIIIYIYAFQDTSIISFVIAILFLGIGHALQINASMSIIFTLSNHHHSNLGQATIISIYNSIERYGSVLGPLICAVIISYYSIEYALIWISILTFVPSLLMLHQFYRWRAK